jgi:ATP-dependent helicase/DNAse subunit B
MAEHVRNELARAQVPIRPSRILTLAKFIEPFTPLADAPESLLHLLIARFGPVSEFRGFHRALANLIVQLPGLPPDLARVAEEIENQLALRGYALREKRLQTAAPIATAPIILDGFFTFSPSELDLIENLAKQSQVTVTLPDWPGSNSARLRLLRHGFTEQRLNAELRQPLRTVFAAPSLEQEVEQIALRILDYSAEGRQFREMGVLLRARDPYASALESTLARFGIPARFHFADALSAHPALQYLTGIIRALLTGWDQADLLTILRMPISGIGATPAGDRLDFEMREGRAGPRPAIFDPPQSWTRDRLTPAAWPTRLKTLRNLLPTPEVTDQIDREQLQAWRSTAAALDAFDEALDITALALNHVNKLTLAEFWPNAEAAFSIEELRVPDHRRNVVNVLDVYEARQWELPIAFVCGLNERQFPQHHRENPLLPNPARLRDRQLEERFLFDLAVTRATEETVVSYARYNDKGDAQLRSFFLDQEGRASSPTRILPAATLLKPVGQVPDLPNPDLRLLHAKLAPTSIESFLQCPFQFFAQKTLKLRQRPEKPRDRLNTLLQGAILHEALAEGSLDAVFEQECQKNNIPRTYRREAVRLELLRHFEAFQLDQQWPLAWPSQTEQEFLFALTPELSIRGRIDRLDLGPANQAIVIDYKYSAAAKIRERIDGDPIQGGLYLSAAQRYFNLQPAGMFYCGLRQSVTWEGWHIPIPGLALGESRLNLRELIEAAENKAIDVFESITSGNVAVRPADRAKCRYCDFRDICRVESQPRARHEIPS